MSAPKNGPLKLYFFLETTDEIIRELGSQKFCHIFCTEMSLFEYGEMDNWFHYFSVRILHHMVVSVW